MCPWLSIALTWSTRGTGFYCGWHLIIHRSTSDLAYDQWRSHRITDYSDIVTSTLSLNSCVASIQNTLKVYWMRMEMCKMYGGGKLSGGLQMFFVIFRCYYTSCYRAEMTSMKFEVSTTFWHIWPGSWPSKTLLIVHSSARICAFWHVAQYHHHPDLYPVIDVTDINLACPLLCGRSCFGNWWRLRRTIPCIRSLFYVRCLW